MARGRRDNRLEKDWHAFGDYEDGQDVTAGGSFGATGLTIASAGTILRLRGKVGVTFATAAVDEHVMIL